MIETQTPAIARFYQLVRDFAVRTPAWGTAIRYQTKPDERADMTLVAERVYGSRDEFLTVLASAGLESVEDQLSERLLVLPNATQLRALKKRAGFVSDDTERQLAKL